MTDFFSTYSNLHDLFISKLNDLAISKKATTNACAVKINVVVGLSKPTIPASIDCSCSTVLTAAKSNPCFTD